MKLSPLDIKHQEFQTGINGYNKAQVREFLEQVGTLLEQRHEEIQTLKETLQQKSHDLEILQIKGLELQQKLEQQEPDYQSEQIMHQAMQESREMVKRAAAQRDAILKDMNERKQKAQSLLSDIQIQAKQEAVRAKEAVIKEVSDTRHQALIELQKLQEDIKLLQVHRESFAEAFTSLVKGYSGQLEELVSSGAHILTQTHNTTQKHLDNQTRQPYNTKADAYVSSTATPPPIPAPPAGITAGKSVTPNDQYSPLDDAPTLYDISPPSPSGSQQTPKSTNGQTRTAYKNKQTLPQRPPKQPQAADGDKGIFTTGEWFAEFSEDELEDIDSLETFRNNP